MYSFFRILYLALYVVCFLTAFAAYYTAVVIHKQGGDLLHTAIWAGAGVILTILAFLLYRVYRKLAGRR